MLTASLTDVNLEKLQQIYDKLTTEIKSRAPKPELTTSQSTLDFWRALNNNPINI